jgi:Tfp pilus assembly protein PilN
VRPVNLIPPEDRRGDRAPLRTGAMPYVIVGALALALVAITLVVTAGNTVSEREAELASLEQQEADAQVRAQALAPYAEFATLQQTRNDTVSSLAQSRFDWERVLREFALILPSDIWLTNMTGTVTSEVVFEGQAEVPIRDSVVGPALAIVGCGSSQDAVARFVAALKDIDGVTRVSVGESKRPELGQMEAGGAGAAMTDDCRTRDFITRFEIVAAFDAATVPAAAPATTPPGTTPAPATPATPTPDDGSGVAETQAGEQAARDSINQQSGEAREAVNLIPGATAR